MTASGFGFPKQQAGKIGTMFAETIAGQGTRCSEAFRTQQSGRRFYIQCDFDKPKGE
jgi:hypothetical protein